MMRPGWAQSAATGCREKAPGERQAGRQLDCLSGPRKDVGVVFLLDKA